MRVLVSGDRQWGAISERQVDAVRDVIATLPTNAVVIEGEARGADSLARDFALERGLEVERFPARWDEHGRAAGPIRNLQMLEEGHPDYLVYFHDNLAQSKGTAHMVKSALKVLGPSKVYRYDQWLAVFKM